MAKKETVGNRERKVNFGKRRGGSAQKTKGKKDKEVSKYRGQGR